MYFVHNACYQFLNKSAEFLNNYREYARWMDPHKRIGDQTFISKTSLEVALFYVTIHNQIQASCENIRSCLPLYKSAKFDRRLHIVSTV